jgi:hypothetical protein
MAEAAGISRLVSALSPGFDPRIIRGEGGYGRVGGREERGRGAKGVRAQRAGAGPCAAGGICPRKPGAEAARAVGNPLAPRARRRIPPRGHRLRSAFVRTAEGGEEEQASHRI